MVEVDIIYVYIYIYKYTCVYILSVYSVLSEWFALISFINSMVLLLFAIAYHLLLLVLIHNFRTNFL